MPGISTSRRQPRKSNKDNENFQCQFTAAVEHETTMFFLRPLDALHSGGWDGGLVCRWVGGFVSWWVSRCEVVDRWHCWPDRWEHNNRGKCRPLAYWPPVYTQPALDRYLSILKLPSVLELWPHLPTGSTTLLCFHTNVYQCLITLNFSNMNPLSHVLPWSNIFSFLSCFFSSFSTYVPLSTRPSLRNASLVFISPFLWRETLFLSCFFFLLLLLLNNQGFASSLHFGVNWLETWQACTLV